MRVKVRMVSVNDELIRVITIIFIEWTPKKGHPTMDVLFDC